MDILDMSDNSAKSPAFKLKGRLYTFTVIELLTNDNDLFAQQLVEVIKKAPRLFANTPVVLDCNPVPDKTIDLSAILTSMRANHLHLVALQGANAALCADAKRQGIALLNASATHDKPIKDNALIDKPITSLKAKTKTKLITTPVRSGQQVICRGGDLVVTAAVSHGAELLADGNIHVYGALRGRALAGLSGDLHSRIFCYALEAELVSIAGFYRLSDAIEKCNGSCQIYLKDEQIHIEPL